MWGPNTFTATAYISIASGSVNNVNGATFTCEIWGAEDQDWSAATAWTLTLEIMGIFYNCDIAWCDASADVSPNADRRSRDKGNNSGITFDDNAPLGHGGSMTLMGAG